MVLIFNDIAGSEILLILVFILIFFGSKSIPNLAKTLGKAMRHIKEASSDIQNEIKKSGVDIKKDLNLKGILEDTAQDIKRPLDQMAVDLENSNKYQPNRPDSKVQLPPTTEELEKLKNTPKKEVKSEEVKLKETKNETPKDVSSNEVETPVSKGPKPTKQGG